MKRAGRIVRICIERMKKAVRPGVTTAELDRIGGAALREHGARSAPKLVYGFPADMLISVNDEAVHGIPGPRRLRDGDLVKLDVTVEKDGYMADAAITVPVGRVSDERRRLVAAARAGFEKAMEVAVAGNRVRDIGRAIEGEVKSRGFEVVRDLCGHGIGRTIHEPPSVPSHYDGRMTRRSRGAGDRGGAHRRRALGAQGGRGRLDGPPRTRLRGALRAHHRHHPRPSPPAHGGLSRAGRAAGWHSDGLESAGW